MKTLEHLLWLGVGMIVMIPFGIGVLAFAESIREDTKAKTQEFKYKCHYPKREEES